MIKLWSEEYVSEVTFSKYSSFDSPSDFIKPKLGQKELKLVFHVPMVKERWKSIVKGNLRWNNCFWIHNFKTVKFFQWWLYRPKNRSTRSKLVFQVLMLIERWKSKVILVFWCELFFYEAVLSKLWSFDSVWWRHQLKIGLKKGPNSYHMS